MKKILIALSAVASLTCAFTLAACGGGEADKAAVTESEWKTALTYFKCDYDEENFMPVSSDYPRINFTCKTTLVYTYDGEDSTDVYTLSVDFDKKANSFEFTVGGEAGDCYYAWKDGNVCYSTGDGWGLDSDTGEFVQFYTKEIIDEEELDDECNANIFHYAGGEHISVLNLTEKFSAFTYSKENAEYTATFDYEEYEGTCDISVKFNNGKLSVLSVLIDSEEYGKYDYTFEYTYGTSVTIPEYFLNMELGETVKPN